MSLIPDHLFSPLCRLLVLSLHVSLYSFSPVLYYKDSLAILSLSAGSLHSFLFSRVVVGVLSSPKNQAALSNLLYWQWRQEWAIVSLVSFLPHKPRPSLGSLPLLPYYGALPGNLLSRDVIFKATWAEVMQKGFKFLWNSPFLIQMCPFFYCNWKLNLHHWRQTCLLVVMIFFELERMRMCEVWDGFPHVLTWCVCDRSLI